MITAKKLSLQYPDGTNALNEINLRIKAGELVYITGPSGSGKTSLIKLLMGMEKPTAGRLEVLSHSMNRIDVKRRMLLRQYMGPVFQELKLINGRTVLDNVILGMRFLPIPKQQWKTLATDALEKVKLSHKIFSYAENLSWGEKQRVAIARAIVRKPSLIIADEPTGNLDRKNAINILELLNSLKQEDTSVIITTHATHLIDSDIVDQLIQIEAGQLQASSMEEF